MEDHAPGACKLSSISPSEPLSTQTLSSLRSLITNPSTPAPAISSIAETLTRPFQLSRDPHRTLQLLSDLTAHHPHLSGLVFYSVRSNSLLSTESTRVAAESLDVLALISERNRDLAPCIKEIDDRLFASLCFSPSPALRPWLLRNAGRFGVRPYLLSSLFLGFTKDPYPNVRRAALDGLVGLSESGLIDDGDMIRGCYFHAGELLNDMEDCVRSAVIRSVLAWGLTLIDCDSEAEKAYWSDEVFVKICSMVRDMSMEVRIEAFHALGKIRIVSEDILLQTLSKKVLVTTKEKKPLVQCSDEQLKVSGSSVAGAFMHGLEDEFHEVRKAACHSLGTLTTLSYKFAGEALNLLMDVLNDDSMLVWLQAFETMHQMATVGRLKVLEKYVHMFLGTLVDRNTLTRSAARKILKLAKLPDLKLFRSTIDTLLDNLEMCPEDEADILNVLFHIGRNHGKFVVRIIEEVSHQMEPVANDKLSFDNVRVAALLVLAISAPLSHERDCCIPPIDPPDQMPVAVSWNPPGQFDLAEVRLEKSHSWSEKSGGSPSSSALSPQSSSDQSRIDKLVQEVEELKAFKNKQTKMMGCLEHKLEQAEFKIKQLTMRLEYESTPSHIDTNQAESEAQLEEGMRLESETISNTREKSIVSCDMLDLDPKESVYLVGGYDGKSWLLSLDSYHPSHDVIRSLGPMSSVRAYASVAKLDGDLYVIGGGDGALWYDTVESYCPADGQWKVCPSLREKKGSLAAATTNNKFFAMGGGNGIDCFSDVEMLDIGVGRWIRTQSMLEKRFSLAAAKLNGVLYATGGYDGIGYLKQWHYL